MKIAIASLGEKIDSEISDVTGRAPFFMIFEDKKLVETIKNPFRFGGGGAGVSVAKMLSDKGVKKFVAGKVGANVESFFKEKEIEIKEEKGKVKNVLK